MLKNFGAAAYLRYFLFVHSDNHDLDAEKTDGKYILSLIPFSDLLLVVLSEFSAKSEHPAFPLLSEDKISPFFKGASFAIDTQSLSSGFYRESHPSE